MVFRKPDLSNRPFSLTTGRLIALPTDVLYRAWTTQFDKWFAAPGSVLMQAEINAPFFFETEYKFEKQELAQRHPHYGRFLRLEKDRLIELTWVTGAGGTEGAETIVTVELIPQDNGTLLSLTHAGFPNETSREGHAKAWPMVLEQMELKMKNAVKQVAGQDL